MPASLPTANERRLHLMRPLAGALLVAAILWVPGVGGLFAAVPEAQIPATSVDMAAAASHAAPAGEPQAAAQPEEHGLPRNAVEIARPFGSRSPTRWS